MSSLKLQLLYFQGCPNIELARSCAISVLADFPGVEFEEFDVQAESTPAEFRDWGSPTFLLAGRDIAGASPAGSCCRLYDEHHQDSRGVPSQDLLRNALQATYVYAPEGTEVNDPRGEFIALQLLETPTKAQKEREKVLYRKHRAEWLGPLSAVVRSQGLVYRGGFPAKGRLFGDRQAELHGLVGHPAWSTFEALDMDGCQDEAASPDFFAHPVMRRALRSLTSLHVQNLADIASDSNPWPLTTIGAAFGAGLFVLGDTVAAQRAAIGLGEGLPSVTTFVAERVIGAPEDWEWLLESNLGRRLHTLELKGTASYYWVHRASQLVQRLERVLLRPDPVFGGSTYDFKRSKEGISLAIKKRAGDELAFHELDEILPLLRESGIAVLTVSIPKGPARTRANLDRLARLCDAMSLTSYRLPKPV